VTPHAAHSGEVLRFAPSPNGLLHLGHAYSALFGFEQARRLGGRFLLRIEDIDVARCRPEFETALYEDLAWLGIEWEQPVRRQSEHFADYAAALGRLRALGLVYPCFATRTEIDDAVRALAPDPARWPRDPDGAPIYPGLYKRLDRRELDRLLGAHRAHAVRLHMDRATALAERIAGGPITFEELDNGPDGERGTLTAAPEVFGDVVIARKDVPTSYHLAVVVDDALQGVTLVTRGQDLFPATHVHRLLQVLLGLPAPRYCHHGLVRDATGRRLAKSARDQGLRELRAAGRTPADIRRMVGLESTDG
jgi:glutamyl-Q tRNA(Asp) synthetase